MDRFVVQVLGRYALWSEVVGAPLTPFVASLERLTAVCPPDGIRHIQVAQMRTWWHVAQNRAGEHSVCLETPEALLAAYPDCPDEPAPPEAEGPEPGQRLYEAVRDMGLLTNGWGPWDTLTREMQEDLGEVAAHFMPKQQPVAEQPARCLPRQHEYAMVDWDRLSLKLTLYCTRCGDWKRDYLA